MKKLRLYKFDWDDNILLMSTKLKVYRNDITEYVSTSEFAQIRNNPLYIIKDDAYDEFRDYGVRKENAFTDDVKKSILDKKFGPSFKKLKECIKYGNFFAVITARGHSPKILQSGVKIIIEQCFSQNEKTLLKRTLKKIYGKYSFDDLVDKYLSDCRFYPVSSSEFSEEFNLPHPGYDTENRKCLSSKHFISYVECQLKTMKKDDIRIVNGGGRGKVTMKVGFSDDDKKYVKSMVDHLTLLKIDKPEISFKVYDTSNPKKVETIII